MPLHHAKTIKTIRANISRNIRAERHAGVPRNQAVATAYGTACTDARKAGVRAPKGWRCGNK